MNTRRTLSSALAASAIALTLAACSYAPTSNTVSFKAVLNGASEVPPVATAASGLVEAKLNKDTNLLTWSMTYSGLSGPATAGHFHGPASETQNTGIALGFNNPVTSPFAGQATLTPAQAADLLAGKWYVNIHTAANKPGEIRGQVKAQ